MKKVKLFLVVLSTIIAAVFCNESARCEDGWKVSISEFPMEKGERVVGFWVKIKSGSVYSLPKVPIAWSMTISNFLNDEPPWNTTIEAVTGVGAGALDLNYFTDFIVIKKKTGVYSEHFDIQITLSTTIDFENEKKKIFILKDLTMKPIPLN